MTSVATFTKFESFSEGLAKGEHNLSTDTLRVVLSNTAPDAAANTVLADITEISAGNGYTAGGEDAQNSVSRTGGTTSVVGVDVVWTASGAIGPARYVILYNDTHASNALVGYWDRGSSVTLASGDTLTTDFGSSLFTVA